MPPGGLLSEWDWTDEGPFSTENTSCFQIWAYTPAAVLYIRTACQSILEAFRLWSLEKKQHAGITVVAGEVPRLCLQFQDERLPDERKSSRERERLPLLCCAQQANLCGTFTCFSVCALQLAPHTQRPQKQFFCYGRRKLSWDFTTLCFISLSITTTKGFVVDQYFHFLFASFLGTRRPL